MDNKIEVEITVKDEAPEVDPSSQFQTDSQEKEKAKSSQLNALISEIPGVGPALGQAQSAINTGSILMGSAGAIGIAITALSLAKKAYNIWYKYDSEVRNTNELRRRAGTEAYYRRRQ